MKPIQDIEEPKRAETKSREAEDVFHVIFDNARDGILVADTTTRRFLFGNKAIHAMLGYTSEETLTLSVTDIHPKKDLFLVFDAFDKQACGEIDLAYDLPVQRKDGSIFYADINSFPLKLWGKSVLVGIFRDITSRKQADAEQKKLQSQLLQAQKMESVGRLAGGVAHDFNNMLQAIMGHIELALPDTPPGSEVRKNLETAQKAALRAADLTRQLLAFARKQTVVPKVLNLNDSVATMLKMLQRMIGEDIDLAWMPKSGLWTIKMDPAQIDQILVNLFVNARDAIAGVGKVTIETANLLINEEDCSNHSVFIPGAYVMMVVSDNGCGMDKEVLAHLFEPFFTTKEFGRGTGLGLATVYGIVKQNHGFINVYSEPGKGTTFRIYLPRHGKDGNEVLTAVPEARPPHGCGETVLIVEDEAIILELGKAMLQKLGYVALTAAKPSEALRQVEIHPGEIHLLITDVVMPEMNGRELAERVRGIKPGLKCLFMSGYTANVIAHHGVLEEGVHFVQKPFSYNELGQKVRMALEN